MFNLDWPTAVAGEADSVSSVSASACHIRGPNSVNPGQILLVYGSVSFSKDRSSAVTLIPQVISWIFEKTLIRSSFSYLLY